MSLSLIVEQLLSEVKRESQAGALSEELLSAQYAVFGAPLLHALAIVDVEGSVTLYSCPAGRILYQVLYIHDCTYKFIHAALKKLLSIICVWC